MNTKWQEKEHPELSVVMLGYRRADLLDKAIESFCSNAAHASWELVLVLNGATESVRNAAYGWHDSNLFPMHVIEIGGLKPGAARNVGVRETRAPVLLFLDDDTECFQDLTQPIREIFADSEVQAAGGPNLTPPRSSAWERAFGYAMASRFGSGGMSQRYRLAPEREGGEHDLILCNLAVKRSVFVAEGGFGFGFESNEENILLQQLEEKKARLIFSPRLAVFHRRRKLPALWQQLEKYGSGRGQNILALPQTFQLLYLVPTFFLLYLVALPFLALRFGEAAAIPLGVYLLAGAFATLWSFLLTGDRASFRMPFLFPMLHCAYGWGLFKVMLTKRAFALGSDLSHAAKNVD